MKKYYIFLAIIWVVAVFLMFLTIGNPIEKRKQKVDELAALDIDRWSSTIVSFYEKNGRLPKSLQEPDRQEFYITEQKSKIDYKIKNEYQYQLCAEFLTDTTDILYESPYSGKKKHKKGYDCIDFEVSGQNYFSVTPVLVSFTPTPYLTPSGFQSIKFYVEGEYDVSGTNTYMQADLSENMTIEYSKDEGRGGKTIINLENKPLLEFTIVTKNNPTHFSSYKELDRSISGTKRYLVSIKTPDKNDVEYYYTDAVSVMRNCSNGDVIDWPCGPVNIYNVAIHFVGDFEDLEIANNIVSNMEFL